MTTRSLKLRAAAARALFLGFVAAAYCFLLLPLVIVVLASFNAGELLTFPPQGFSLRWYTHFFSSKPFMDSLFFSLRLAATAMIISTLLGTVPRYMWFASPANGATDCAY
jgi:putative spermidine/putrescine transport system permease protein